MSIVKNKMYVEDQDLGSTICMLLFICSYLHFGSTVAIEKGKHISSPKLIPAVMSFSAAL